MVQIPETVAPQYEAPAVKLLIAGSRTVHPTDEGIDRALRQLEDFLGDAGWGIPGGYAVSLVIGGRARSGADPAGERWARARDIPFHPEPVTQDDYDKHGKLGPKMRNRRMAEMADAALVFWDGVSGGSSDMVCRMVARRKPVLVVPMAPAKR